MKKINSTNGVKAILRIKASTIQVEVNQFRYLNKVSCHISVCKVDLKNCEIKTDYIYLTAEGKIKNKIGDHKVSYNVKRSAFTKAIKAIESLKPNNMDIVNMSKLFDL